MQQLELFSWDQLSKAELLHVVGAIRSEYWFIRARKGYNPAAIRKRYRVIERHKKRLLMAGVKKRELLDLLACLRTGCRGKKCLQCAP